uniref:Murine leukemia virus integrase C-terminal domain-containing protein n=1 Tax=Strix occidentalis caurina TaxID=311401 RepID=A0A8D0KR93_STROC
SSPKHYAILWNRPLSLENPVHDFQPGDYVYVRTLSPRWEGPFLVLLTTETAVRTAEREWTHISRVKGPVTGVNRKMCHTGPHYGGWLFLLTVYVSLIIAKRSQNATNSYDPFENNEFVLLTKTK